MKIGFYIKFNKNSINSRGNVIGEELFGESLCRSLRKIPKVLQAELFAPNYPPNEKLDLIVYLNDTKPKPRWATKHIIYVQNAYKKEAYDIVKENQEIGYDGYIFFSNKMLEIHRSLGGEGLFLPFGVDLEFFKPTQAEDRYRYDVSYVGSDIKGEERTTRYLMPATNYNLGLFGNWKIPKSYIRFWKSRKKQPAYRKTLAKLSKGKIPQKDVPILYSSSKINLNYTAQAYVEWDVITLRTYEILACKGFLITDIVPIAEKTMQGCMVFTNGGDDLLAKIDYYLGRENMRKEIAETGYRYVIENASIETRARELFDYLERIL
jgi:spore maturation protein CgeB